MASQPYRQILSFRAFFGKSTEMKKVSGATETRKLKHLVLIFGLLSGTAKRNYHFSLLHNPSEPELPNRKIQF